MSSINAAATLDGSTVPSTGFNWGNIITPPYEVSSETGTVFVAIFSQYSSGTPGAALESASSSLASFLSLVLSLAVGRFSLLHATRAAGGSASQPACLLSKIAGSLPAL